MAGRWPAGGFEREDEGDAIRGVLLVLKGERRGDVCSRRGRRKAMVGWRRLPKGERQGDDWKVTHRRHAAVSPHFLFQFFVWLGIGLVDPIDSTKHVTGSHL